MAGNIFLEGPVRLTAGLDRQSNGQPADMPVSFPHCIQYTKCKHYIQVFIEQFKSCRQKAISCISLFDLFNYSLAAFIFSVNKKI